MSDKKRLGLPAQFQQLDHELATAKFCFTLYQNVALDSSSISKSASKKWFRTYSNLVQAERALISQSIFIQLHKFFDSHRKSIHLEEIVEGCKKNPGYDLIKEKYDSLHKEHIKTITRLRHSVYAHTDAFTSPEDAFNDVKMSYSDIKKILEGLEEIMQGISKALPVARLKNVDAQIVQQEHKKLIEAAIGDLE